MNPITPAISALSALAALALPTSTTAQTIKFDKSVELDYSAALAARSYATPEQAIDDIHSLAPPWNHLFTIPIRDALLMPGPEHWVRSTVLDNTNNIAIVEAAAAIPDGIGAGTASASSAHVILLLQRRGRTFKIADHLILRASAYDGSTPFVINDPGWGLLLHLDTYRGGRRDGDHTHTLFTIDTGGDSPSWHPALQLRTRYSQREGSQSVSFGAAPATGIATTVTTEPGQNGAPPAASSSVTLTWDNTLRTFDITPVSTLLTTQANAVPAPTVPDHPWVITPGKSIGPVNHHTTVAELIAIFGTTNVTRGKISLGGDEQADGFIVYPASDEKIELVLGPAGKVVQANLHGKKSKWITDTGITLGSTPSTVQDANGQPFEISNFEWDYAGLVESWGEGVLDDDLRVQFSYANQKAYKKLSQQTEAAGRWLGQSDSSGILSLDLTVTSIYVVLKP